MREYVRGKDWISSLKKRDELRREVLDNTELENEEIAKSSFED